MLLTAQLLLNYQRCRRRAFLDVHGEAGERLPPSDFLLKLGQDSLAHRQAVLAEQSWVAPTYPQGNWQAGVAATLTLMQQGVEQIHQGILLAEMPEGYTGLGLPDLLVRQPGHSYFGDWLYAPIDIKLSRRPKLEYQIILSFQVLLLAQLQGAWPETAWLWLRERGLYPVDLWQTLPQLQPLLVDLHTMLQQKSEPEVFISRNQCSLCSWFDHCYGVARAQNHLSLLPGVTASRYSVLQAQRLLTVEDLARLNPRQLEPLPGFGSEVAIKLVHQAQAVLHNQPLPLPGLMQRLPGLLPTASVELYFDIEAEPGLNLAFLHGILVVNRQQQTQTFYPLVAERPEDEAQVWQQFVELVQRYPTAPIFHFCAYETQTIERLGKLYRTPRQAIQSIVARCVDLHYWVTQTVTLPIENYTLKLIAKFVGFEWRDASANGAQAIYWYTQWLQTGERSFLEAIISYNEDDCRATYRVKDWLAVFLQEQVENPPPPLRERPNQEETVIEASSTLQEPTLLLTPLS